MGNDTINPSARLAPTQGYQDPGPEGWRVVELRFIRNRNIFSRLIQWQSWGKWSHVDVKMPNGYLGALWGSGVQIRPLNYTDYLDEETACVVVTHGQFDAIDRFLAAQIGKPYDWRSLFGFLLRRDWESEKAWFCSELVAAAFLRAGVPLLRTIYADRISPSILNLSPLLRG